ncbi:cofilin-like [Lytechinus variegatus]|uniref:cofilin-like n=1 Tax=Lytechinus variegatus TaxID=7654 RepID=UPI001BB242D8|nr:cofilin-like [Lytechinus variegatus]XP_041469243.1 cofilin-like [Lytechinus variegatus]
MSSGMTADPSIIKNAKEFLEKGAQYIVIELVEKEDDGQKKRSKEYVWRDITDGSRSQRIVGKTHDLVERDEVKPNFDEFRDTYFNDDRACLAYYDFTLIKPLVGSKAYKIGAFKWCPDTLPVGKKMVFGSSVEKLKKDCDVAAYTLPGTDPDELVFENVLKEMHGK